MAFIQRRLSAAICSARINDLAPTSAEARQARALLLTFVLPSHEGAAVAAVEARVGVALTHHVRVLPIASITALSSWASALDSAVRDAAYGTRHVSIFASRPLARSLSHHFTPATVIAVGTVAFANRLI